MPQPLFIRFLQPVRPGGLARRHSGIGSRPASIIVLKRSRRRAPNLRMLDRLIAGFCSLWIMLVANTKIRHCRYSCSYRSLQFQYGSTRKHDRTANGSIQSIKNERVFYRFQQRLKSGFGTTGLQEPTDTRWIFCEQALIHFVAKQPINLNRSHNRSGLYIISTSLRMTKKETVKIA
jgi:hypothetical protein